MAEDTMFQDAVDVLKQGDKARAKYIYADTDKEALIKINSHLQGDC